MARSTGDEMLGGGVPESRTLPVRGPPGVGRSRLAVQFLGAGADTEEDCLYVMGTWRGGDELPYLSVPESPAGTPGHARRRTARRDTVLQLR
ncbi:ATPase domain-containing protein [Halorientalis sp.]|uniref:ATPase domain-containing protein n=1 Tax=Halorientalis sp. TaxID=1931229 RepID=UPI00262B575F|nr:ATPase domain-containing protein [Halorientalis sp.]